MSQTQSSKPGAYAVEKTGHSPAQEVNVVVPAQVRPGQDFFVQLGERRVRCKCPMNSGPGQRLRLTMPAEAMFATTFLQMAPLTAAEGPGGGGAVARASGKEQPQAYLVTIPPSVYPGMPFVVDINGQRFQSTCPPNVGPNMKVKIVPPVTHKTPPSSASTTTVHAANQKEYTVGWDDNRTLPPEAADASKSQMFEVVVPPGVKPQQSFAIKANGQRVLVTCPPNVRSGQKIRFQIPVTQTMVKHIQLNYDHNTSSSSDAAASDQTMTTASVKKQLNTGWCRTIRASDLKFQWVRVEDEEEDGTKNDTNASQRLLLDTSAMDHVNFRKSAYCRQITYLEGNDTRLRTGRLAWIPAKDAAIESKVAHKGTIMVSYADLAEIQAAASLEIKLNWFESNICQPLILPYDTDGHMKIVVRRQYLLPDSVAAIMSLSRLEMRKKWRLEFVGEKGM